MLNMVERTSRRVPTLRQHLSQGIAQRAVEHTMPHSTDRPAMDLPQLSKRWQIQGGTLRSPDWALPSLQCSTSRAWPRWVPPLRPPAMQHGEEVGARHRCAFSRLHVRALQKGSTHLLHPACQSLTCFDPSLESAFMAHVRRFGGDRACWNPEAGASLGRCPSAGRGLHATLAWHLQLQLMEEYTIMQ